MNTTYIKKEDLIRKGEHILVIEAKNSPALQGALVEMVSADNSNQSFTIKVVTPGDGPNPFSTGYTTSLYNSGPADEYIKADKASKLKYFNDKLVALELDRTKILGEIEFLEKYDSMEEFVADKIGLLIQADTKESRVAILKTLKQTNYL